MIFIKKHPFLSFFCLLLFWVLMIRVSNSLGFCSAQMRFISDDELLEMTLKPYYETDIELLPEDTSVKAYINNHPDCCYIRNTMFFDLLDRTAKKITLKYLISDEALQSYGGETNYERYISISACGEFIGNKGFGLSQSYDFSDDNYY